MDHDEAIRIGAVERYLLDDLPARERSAFEEHFFGCSECAAELRMTAEFLDTARRELKHGDEEGDSVDGPGPPPSNRAALSTISAGTRVPAVAARRRSRPRWYPALSAAAAAGLLCVVGYQNLFVYPRLNAQLAQLNGPSVLDSIYLVGGNTRDQAASGATASQAKPLLLSVDIPTGGQYADYACILHASDGTVVWKLPVGPEQAKDTVPIVVPAGSLPAGHYTLIVEGYMKGAGQASADLAHYPFTISNPN